MTNFPTRCSLLPGLFPMSAATREAFDGWRALAGECGYDAAKDRLAAAHRVRDALGLPPEAFRRIGGVHGFAAQAARKDAVIAAARQAGVAPPFLEKAAANPLALLALPGRMIAIETQKFTRTEGANVFGLPEDTAPILAKADKGILDAIRLWSTLDETLPLSLPTLWAETAADTPTALRNAARAFRSEAGILAAPLHVHADEGWTRHIDALPDAPDPTEFIFRSGAVVAEEGTPEGTDNDAFAFLALLQAAVHLAAPIRLVALMADFDISCRAPRALLAAANVPPTWRLGMRIHNAFPASISPTVSLRFGPEERPAGLRLRFIEA